MTCSEKCTVPNYDSCSCEPDPDPCCGLEGTALACCQSGLTCGECEKANYETCSCEEDPEGTYTAWGQTLECDEHYCFCRTLDLYYCGTSSYAYTICCDPRNGGCGDEDCMSDAYWITRDLTGICIPTSGGPDTDQFIP